MRAEGSLRRRRPSFQASLPLLSQFSTETVRYLLVRRLVKIPYRYLWVRVLLCWDMRMSWRLIFT